MYSSKNKWAKTQNANGAPHWTIRRSLGRMASKMIGQSAPPAPTPAPAAPPAPAPPAAAPKPAAAAPKPAAAAPKPAAAAAESAQTVEAKFARNSWTLDKAGAGEVTISPKTMHAVNVYGSKGTVVRVDGKCANVQLEGCERVELHVTDVIGTVEVSNCKRVKVFVSGVAPSISIDKTDGVLLELSEACVAFEDFMVVAANSSEMNAAFEHDGEKVELPLPEQFVHKVERDADGHGKVVSEVSGIYAA